MPRDDASPSGATVYSPGCQPRGLGRSPISPAPAGAVEDKKASLDWRLGIDNWRLETTGQGFERTRDTRLRISD